MKLEIRSLVLGMLIATLASLVGTKLAQEHEKRELNELREEYTPKDNRPICLRQREGGQGYVILEVDKEAKLYRGIKAMVFLQVPFELPARELNERPDLQLIDCGQ